MNKSNKAEAMIKPIEDAFCSIGYKRSLIRKDYAYTDFFAREASIRTIDIAIFGQEPTDFRSACFGVKFFDDSSTAELVVNELRAFGAPQLFIVRNARSERWRNTQKRPIFREELRTDTLPKIIRARRKDWNPERIIRQKSGFPEPEATQLDFIDVGLLPALEHEASAKIDSLIRRVLYRAEQELKRNKIPFDAPTIFNIVFRLLTAKLLKDRDIKTEPGIDLSQPLASLIAASQYYGYQIGNKIKTLPKELLEGISKEIRDSFSLCNLSVDTLAYVYENTFVSGKTRKELGIHSTPSYIAEYVLSLMPIEDLPRSKWNVLDPMCGHGIFLIAAMRRMRNLLPSDWGLTRRHRFFMERLHGIEIDHFSIEVARMCLMLADFPESNSWDLRRADVFDKNILESSVANATIIVGNPPFETMKENGPEIPKPVHLLKRILPSLTEGGLIGVVLPRSFLDGIDYQAERSVFLQDFHVLCLTSLPDRVFLHSDAETVIVVARKQKSKIKKYTIYREVKGHHKERFRTRYNVTWEDKIPQAYFSDQQDGRLVLPMLREIWERLDSLPRLGDIAEIKKGVEYEPKEVKGKLHEIVQSKPFSRSKPGIYNVTDGFKSFVADDTVYMSTDRKLRRKRAMGAWELDWDSPKVIIPTSRTSRGPWCYAAAIDTEKRLLRRSFCAVWPKNDNVEVELLAALLNSPLAQAFVHTHTSKRNIPARIYESIPVPQSLGEAGQIIVPLVSEYLRCRSTDLKKAKEILLQIDAEILKLYKLPPRQERQVLDIFWGDTRRRVPFGFTGYIPPDQTSLREEQLSPEMISLYSSKEILRFLPIALDILHDCFASILELHVLPEQDPETGEKWILIDIAVEGDIAEVLDSYDNYAEQWVSSAPWLVRENIRLSYDIV